MHIFSLDIFGIQIAPTWYGLMYAIGFLVCYLFFRKYSKLPTTDIDSLLTFVFFGVILGGRIGYILLYNPSFFLENPREIFAVWKGGMSFHGGFLGVLFAIFLFAKKYRYSFFAITDTLAAIIPIALGLGRIGNYINGELLGYMGYSGPFAIIRDGIPYFPSPLLEMILEGIVLLGITLFTWYWIRKNQTKTRSYTGLVSAVFLIGYSIGRLIAEVFRLPDAHIGYLLGTDWLTLGIVYTVPMLLVGLILLWGDGIKKI